jgi:hypothetical protein
MDASQERSAQVPDPNQGFYDKAVRALTDLCERAKATQELHFVMALMPEFRGMQDAGWSTAHEAVRAYDEFSALVKSLSPEKTVRARVVLAFYAHVAEGSGFYEIPKKLLLTIEGRGNNIRPFQSLVERHRKTGDGAPVRRRHRLAMSRQVLAREAAKDVRDLDHDGSSASEAGHQSVEDGFERDAGRFGEVGVDGGGGDVDVAEQDLHDPGVDAVFEQSRRVAVAQLVRSNSPLDPRRTSGVLEGEAQHLRVDGLSA